MKVRHTLIPEVVILFKKGDNILFLRRANTGYADGKLVPPSGHVEAGEPFSVAAVREAAEEVGVAVRPEDLKPFTFLQRRTPEGQERMTAFFIVEKWDGELLNNEPHKCSELVWLPFNKLPLDVMPFIRHGIGAGCVDKFYSELWE